MIAPLTKGQMESHQHTIEPNMQASALQTNGLPEEKNLIRSEPQSTPSSNHILLVVLTECKLVSQC